MQNCSCSILYTQSYNNIYMFKVISEQVWINVNMVANRFKLQLTSIKIVLLIAYNWTRLFNAKLSFFFIKCKIYPSDLLVLYESSKQPKTQTLKFTNAFWTAFVYYIYIYCYIYCIIYIWYLYIIYIVYIYIVCLNQ